MKKSSLLASLALATTTFFSSAAGEGWLTDFEAAKATATEEKKNLLVEFTGSDWCPPCKLLNKEVFQTDEFKKGIAEKFILVELDFPKDKSSQSEALQKQNIELQEKFRISQFPTVLLLDEQGRPFAQTGYQEGGPGPFLKTLDELLKNRTERDEKLAAAQKLEGVAKAKALFDAIAFLPLSEHVFYSDITDEILKLDPKNETGYHTAAASLELEQAYIAAMQGGKVDEAMILIDAFLKKHQPKGEELQKILSMKMDPLLGTGKFDEAEKVMEKIIAAGPETELGKFAENFKPQLAQMKAQTAGVPTTPETPPGPAIPGLPTKE